MDSFEGGDRYRSAVYGPDRRGQPTRNLFRHAREYPDPQKFGGSLQIQGIGSFLGAPGVANAISNYGPFPGSLGADPAATAQDDDYEMRRSRTPVPEFVAEAVETHLAKVYDQEVHREAPADVTDWWLDVDGRGTPIDDWMRDTVAPLLLVLGCLDVCLDHPAVPEGEEIVTRADELEFGTDACVASIILPENMVWWSTDTAGRYTQCLVREYVDPSNRIDTDESGNPIDPEDKDSQHAEDWRRNYLRYRHWDAAGWTLYDCDGSEVLDARPHSFGRVPIVRLIDMPKHRTPHIGKSRYEAIAEYQREYYNRDSELILSDTLQAHPFLSGPQDFAKGDNTVSVGPGYVLPMKRDTEHGGYQGWEFVSPPKDPAESLRKNKQDIVDAKDRRACLSKPAGAVAGATTAQSGVSKQLDAVTGHKLLASIAKSLAKAERFLAEYAALVLSDGTVDAAEDELIDIVYPAKFELFGAAELIDNLTKLQLTLTAAGEAPNTEREILQAIVRQTLLGLTDEEYELLDAELEAMVETKSRLMIEVREMNMAGAQSRAEALAGDGSTEAAAGTDPSGQSGGTRVSGMVSSQV